MGGVGDVPEPVLGVLMLDALTTSLPGSIANPYSHRARTEYCLVPGATVGRVLRGDETLTPGIVTAARDLVGWGASGITSNCGFLGLYQPAVAAAVQVPVFLSSLLVVPFLAAVLPAGRRVGILTYDAALLSRRQFEGCGWNPEQIGVAVAGVQDLASWRVLSAPDGEIDPQEMERDLLAVGRTLRSSAPDMGALVLECAAMCPFAGSVQRALRLPVFDINSVADLFLRSLTGPVYDQRTSPPNDPRIPLARVRTPARRQQ